MWYFQGGGSKHWPSYIFSGVRTPNPQDRILRSWVQDSNKQPVEALTHSAIWQFWRVKVIITWLFGAGHPAPTEWHDDAVGRWLLPPAIYSVHIAFIHCACTLKAGVQYTHTHTTLAGLLFTRRHATPPSVHPTQQHTPSSRQYMMWRIANIERTLRFIICFLHLRAHLNFGMKTRTFYAKIVSVDSIRKSTGGAVVHG